MTIKEALLFGEKVLHNLETPNLDTAVLLAFVVKKPKLFIYAYGEKNLTTKQRSTFLKLIKRRAKYEPVAYLIGKKEFYGRDFIVNHSVLIPRPETELIIDIAKTIATDTIIDVGTGSGAIAITLAKELHKRIIAIDSSTKALAVAKQNARHHHANVQFLRGNLLEPIKKVKKLKAVLIVANLPYLPTEHTKILSVDIKKYEPRLALMGGTDGLKYYYQLLKQICKLSATQWTLVAEIDALQEKSFTQIAKKILPTADLIFKKDLAGYIRVAILTKA